MLHSPRRAVSEKIAFCLLFIPGTVLAEVSDKEPSIISVWSVGVTAALVCYFGSRQRRWLAPVLGALPVLWFASLFVEIHSTDIGSYLYAEQGPAYYVQAYLSFTTFVVGLALGLHRNKWKKDH